MTECGEFESSNCRRYACYVLSFAKDAERQHEDRVVGVYGCKAVLNKQQLDSYYERVSTTIARRPVFKDFRFAYVVLDRELGSYDAKDLEELGNRWALLDYSWLEGSAKRARFYLQRNNNAAELLIAYCEKQTTWRRPQEAKIAQLASEIASSHEVVVDAIRPLLATGPSDWVPSDFTKENSELLPFVQQHRQLCENLIEFSGLAAIRVGIQQRLPNLNNNGVDEFRSWLGFVTPTMQQLADGPDGYWPLYIKVRRSGELRANRPYFALRIVWCGEHLAASMGADGGTALRNFLAERFPALRRFADRIERNRKVLIKNDLSSADAVQYAVELAEQVDELLIAASKRGICSLS